jgi:hypothetical protein
MASSKRKRSLSPSTENEESESSDYSVSAPVKSSEAEAINRNLIRIFEVALQADIEVDLVSVIPSDYQDRLAEAKAKARTPPPVATPPPAKRDLPEDEARRENPGLTPESEAASEFKPDYFDEAHIPVNAIDLRPQLNYKAAVNIIFPLSEKVKCLLAKYTNPRSERNALAESIVELCWDGGVLDYSHNFMVLRCGGGIVAKIRSGNVDDTTEYTSCQYLAQHAPDVPVPRMHGCVTLGGRRMIFMDYISSVSLDRVWTQLSHDNKLCIQDRLNQIFTSLRKLRRAEGQPIGGVNGEAPWEVRPFSEKSRNIISTSSGFERFSTAVSPNLENSPYLKFLRSFVPPSEPGSVFTHGDLRPANIMVERDEQGQYFVTAIIDWEFSGFYPDYHESVTLSRYIHSLPQKDWCLYLPDVVAPQRHPLRFFFDQIFEEHYART